MALADLVQNGRRIPANVQGEQARPSTMPFPAATATSANIKSTPKTNSTSESTVSAARSEQAVRSFYTPSPANTSSNGKAKPKTSETARSTPMSAEPTTSGARLSATPAAQPVVMPTTESQQTPIHHPVTGKHDS